MFALLAAADLEASRDAWQRLADTALEPSVFNEPGFALAAAHHLDPSRRVMFATAWQGQVQHSPLLGLLPIVPAHLGSLSTVSAWLHPQATAAFPLLETTEPDRSLVSLIEGIGSTGSRPAALILHGLDVMGPTARLLAVHRPFRRLDERSRAVLLRATPSASSGKARKEMKRQWNRLAEQGTLSFHNTSDPARMTEALRRFLNLEEQGWKGRRGTALARTSELAGFAQEVVANLAQRGSCRIDALELDGRTIAAGIVLTSGTRAFFWKTAYDETLARFSPGVQLASRLTEWQATEQSVELTDSCAIPKHGMIDRLWPDRIEVADYILSTVPEELAAFRAAAVAETCRRRVRAVAKQIYRRVISRT